MIIELSQKEALCVLTEHVAQRITASPTEVYAGTAVFLDTDDDAVYTASGDTIRFRVALKGRNASV
jgi:hypothetical protein